MGGPSDGLLACIDQVGAEDPHWRNELKSTPSPWRVGDGWGALCIGGGGQGDVGSVLRALRPVVPRERVDVAHRRGASPGALSIGGWWLLVRHYSGTLRQPQWSTAGSRWHCGGGR